MLYKGGYVIYEWYLWIGVGSSNPSSFNALKTGFGTLKSSQPGSWIGKWSSLFTDSFLGDCSDLIPSVQVISKGNFGFFKPTKKTPTKPTALASINWTKRKNDYIVQ